MKLAILLLFCSLSIAMAPVTFNGNVTLKGNASFPNVASVGWSPTTPSNGLVEWLKADALALSDNDPVTTWTASVGKDAAGSGTTRPLFKTNVKNSLPVVRFDGVDDYLQTAAFDVEATQPFTAIYVFKFNDISVDGANLVGGLFQHNIEIYNKNNFVNQFTLYAGANEAGMIAHDTSWHILIIVWNGASTTYQFDGGSELTTSASPGTISLTGLVIGSYFGHDCCWGSVDVGEICIWSGTLGSGDKTSARSYANTKWSVY